MVKEKDEKAYLKLAQLLATSKIPSVLSEKYSDLILIEEGSINYQISADTVLGSTKSEFLGCTLLHLAYKQDKLNLFNLLLKNGIDFNIKNQIGSSVLHQIVEDTYEKEAESSVLKSISKNPYVISLLEALVKSGNSSNYRNKKGITYFHIACMTNHKEAVDLLLKGEVQVNRPVAKDSPIFPGYTAVHFAARFSHLDTVKVLLDNGGIHYIKDTKGMNPLHILLQQNIEIADMLNKSKVKDTGNLVSRRKTNEDIIRLLLDEIPDQANVIDDTNLTRLHVACVMESLPIMLHVRDDPTYINQAVNERLSIFAGNTALHFAALCNVEKVKLLLKKGANIHLQNAKGERVFGMCVDRYGLKDIHDIIATQPTWKNIQLSIPGKTMLDMVSSLKTQDFSFFINHKKTIKGIFVHPKSPLWSTYYLQHLAVIFSERGCKNDISLIEKVMKKAPKTSLHALAKLAISPLHLAFRLKKAKVVNFLLGCNISETNFLDAEKLSHLHIACAAGVDYAVKILLLAGAQVNISVQAEFEWYRNSQAVASNLNLSREIFIPKGATPLHVAVIVGNCDTMKLLLDHGADIYAQDEHGMTPIHWLIVSDNPISPAADILLSASKPISKTSPVVNNKRLATSLALKECITKDGLSHLHVACFANNVTAVEQLLKKGHASMIGISSCSVHDAKRFPGKFRYAGSTPLHFALENKNETIVSLLIEKGADFMLENPIKKSIPLYDAFNDKSSPCSDIFISFFKNNKALQEQLKEAFGLTMLHFYCYLLDYDAAEMILNEGDVDVNKPMLADSPIWPGFTPLHVLMKFYQSPNDDADSLLRLLLDFGANIVELNSEKNSPVHLAYDLKIEASMKAAVLTSLLGYQKNFDMNPKNSRGLTHFHISCALNDVVIIEKFLENKIDVNQAVDCFYGDKELSGRTPLHLILFHPLNLDIDVVVKLKAVGVLIDHTADVNAKNILGNTPLHIVAKCYSKHISLLAKFVNCGGDMYAKNILAQTPFEIMLNSKDMTLAGVDFFLDNGYPANSYNPITQKGFIAMTFSSRPPSTFEKQRLVFDRMMKACGDTLDHLGRTIIHNVVSTSTPIFSDKFYIKLIESLVKIVDIDHQDNLGRTALHVATQFKNHRAVLALVQVGADINITDIKNKTAFTYAFETSTFFEGPQDNSELIVKIFSQYVQKLNVCQLDVNKMNETALVNAFNSYNVDVNVTQSFYNELDLMKDLKIESTSLTLLNVISGTNSESINSCISKLDHEVFDDLFVTIDKERFSESLGIMRLQCRKFSKHTDVQENV